MYKVSICPACTLHRDAYGAAAPPRFQLKTGQYECGNASSLIPKLVLICSAADVSIVPETCTTNVIVQARIVVRHFLDEGKLKGFEGSIGEVQVMNVGFDFEAGGDTCASAAPRLDG